VISFDKQTKRTDDELWKAGKPTMILKDRNVQDYDSSKKEQFFVRDLTGGVPAMSSVCSRNAAI